MPFVAAYILGDTLGPGWAHQVLWSIGVGLRRPAALNFGSFWLVGVPLGYTLAFHHGKRLAGLWTGLATGMWLHGGGLVLYCLCGGIRWARAVEGAEKRAAPSVSNGTRNGRASPRGEPAEPPEVGAPKAAVVEVEASVGGIQNRAHGAVEIVEVPA